MKSPLLVKPKQKSSLLLLIPLAILLVCGVYYSTFQVEEVSVSETPVGVSFNKASLAGITGPLKAYATAANFQSYWFLSTITSYCWSTTAYNVARLAAKRVFDATDPAKGWRIDIDRVETKITDQLRYWMKRMEEGKQGCGIPKKDHTPAEIAKGLWDRNPGLMGVDYETVKTKKAWEWCTAYKAVQALGMGTEGGNTLPINAETGPDAIRQFKKALTAGLVVFCGCTYNGDSDQFQHYITIGGFKMEGNDAYFAILDPSYQAPTPADNSADLAPWAFYKLAVKPENGHLEVVGHRAGLFIVHYSKAMQMNQDKKKLIFGQVPDNWSTVKK